MVVPDYFMKSEAVAPEPKDFKQWPLSTIFEYKLVHVTEKPKFMQPKSNNCTVTCEHYLISPRLLVRKATFNNEGFPYADSFNMDYKLTFEQYDDPSGNPKTHMKGEFKVNILKPIRFLQSTVIKETEASLKDVYSTSPYKD